MHGRSRFWGWGAFSDDEEGKIPDRDGIRCQRRPVITAIRAGIVRLSLAMGRLIIMMMLVRPNMMWRLVVMVHDNGPVLQPRALGYIMAIVIAGSIVPITAV